MAQLNGLNLNADGDKWYSGINIGDILKIGSKTYSDTLKAQTDADNAAAAIQLEKLKIQQARSPRIAYAKPNQHKLMASLQAPLLAQLEQGNRNSRRHRIAAVVQQNRQFLWRRLQFLSQRFQHKLIGLMQHEKIDTFF